jgi:hypothetical protein
VGLVKGAGDSCVVIHKAIMRRVKAKYIAHAIVVICCFFSSYLALAGTILTHIIFTFSGLIELLCSVFSKKIKAADQPPLALGPESHPEIGTERNDYYYESLLD